MIVSVKRDREIRSTNTSHEHDLPFASQRAAE